MSKTIQETRQARLKALLVGIQLPRVSDDETRSSLEELRRLVDTLGYDVVGSTSQKRPSSAGAIVVGEGKLVELAKWSGGPGVVQSSVKVKKTKAAEKFAQKGDEDDDDTDNFEDDDDSSGNDENDGVSTTEFASDDSASNEVSDHSDSHGDITGDSETIDDGSPGRADVIVFDCELSPS